MTAPQFSTSTYYTELHNFWPMDHSFRPGVGGERSVLTISVVIINLP